MSREKRIIRELRQAGFTVLTRKQWGSRHRAQYQWRRVHRHFVGPADHHVAHITVTNDTGDLVGEFKADCRTVERIGQERFGTGTSYNYMVDQKDGTIAIGQAHDAAGAHTLNDKNVAGFHDNLNYWMHAIAWVGVPSDRVSQRAKNAFSAIIAAEKKHGAAKRRGQLFPHSKFAFKDCPCDQIRDEIPSIERRSKNILRPETQAQRRNQDKVERKHRRKKPRRQEPDQARKQRDDERRRPIAKVRAKTGHGNRVDTGRAFIQWASNIAFRKGNKGRARVLRKWLKRGPKGSKK